MQGDDRPGGGFQWTAELEGALPFVRGLGVPARAPVPPMAPEDFASQNVWGYGHPQGLVERGRQLGQAWSPWSREQAIERLTRARLRRPDFDDWLEATYQVRCALTWFNGWALRLALSLHGPAFAFELLLRQSDLDTLDEAGWISQHAWAEHLEPLRSAIAAADDAPHAKLLARAVQARTASPHQRMLCAQLFPERGDWAQEFLARPGWRAQQPLMMGLHLAPAEFAERLKRGLQWDEGWRAALLLQARLHGDAAFECFAAVFTQAWGGNERDNGRQPASLQLLSQFQHPRLPQVLAAQVTHRAVREAMEQLAQRFPQAVLAAAVPAAMAATAVEQAWLRRLAVQHADALEAALTQVDAATAGRLRASLASRAAPEAAWDQVPAVLREPPAVPAGSKAGKLPPFFAPESLRRPELRSGGALPEAAMRHLAQMLALSTAEAPHPGLAAVREHCTPASLADFVWDLWEAWLGAGATPSTAWAFRALGWLGDDGTARQLAARVRQWGEGTARARALQGLEVLSLQGGDLALLRLDAFTRERKPKLKPLAERAAQLLQAFAAARGIDADTLADRLVPTLDLDAGGALHLDFGPRQFQVRFDETLTPWLEDADKMRLKAIPRPNQDDDAALAASATARYKALRTDLATVAKLQLARLERAMVRQRRWTAAEFRRSFAAHPLMRHLAGRLLWATYEGGALRQAFRIAEDGTLADVQDRGWDLPENATIGLPHAMELPKALHDAFAQVFADYEIAQPFKQFGRESYALSAEEGSATELGRWQDHAVASTSLLGLTHRGWAKGDSAEAVTWSFDYLVRDGLRAQLDFEPGLYLLAPKAEPVQRLQRLTLRARSAGGRWEPAPFERLTPLEASELLRDVQLMRRVKG